MGNIGKATEPRSINNNQWQPTQVTDIYLTVLCTPFINRFMYRQHVPVYDLEKRRGDCLIKWLIMLGFIDLRGPRVCRRSTPVLFFFLCIASVIFFDISFVKFYLQLNSIMNLKKFLLYFSLFLWNLLTEYTCYYIQLECKYSWTFFSSR